MRGSSLAASPIAPLVAFSAATNLGIAGRSARVDAGVPEAVRLQEVLRGFGARIVEGTSAQVVFTVDPAVVAAPADPSVVVVDCRASVAPLARDADARIDFAREHMPVSRALAAALGELARGVRIGVSMVLEPKTAVLALLLQEAGAHVDLFAFALETDQPVVVALVARGVTVHASATATPAQERAHAMALLDAGPLVLVDDGAHVIRLAHRERPDVIDGLIGATEETTSGVTPLVAMAAAGELRIPVIAANDALTKTWFDNRHGTGETCVLAIVRTLDDDLDGAAVTVIGFGPVGEGCAQRLRALGARVTVVDRDPRRALAARYAGFAVAPIMEAVAAADLVVSATGVPGTVDHAVLAACRHDAAIAVAGGAPEEVQVPTVASRETIAPHLERVRLPDAGSVRLLAGGECVNIVAGEGNPIDVMDLSFAVQLTAIRRLLAGPELPPGVHPLGDDLDSAVAAAALGEGMAAARADAESPDWRRTRFDTT